MTYVDYLIEAVDSFFVLLLGSNQNWITIAVCETLTFIGAIAPFVIVPLAIHKFIMLIVRLKNGY